MRFKKRFAAIAVAVGTVGAGVGFADASARSRVTLTAGGATFPLNIIEACRADFAQDTTYNSIGDAVNYTGVGSGTGRQNFYSGTYKFAMSDAIPSATGDASRGYRASFVLVPMIAGAIGVSYRLDGVKPEGTILQLSPTTVARIFAGQITKWDDAAIKADNPVVAKPKLEGLNKFLTVTAVKGKKAGTIDMTVNIKGGLVTSKTKNLIIRAIDPTGKQTPIYNKKPKTGALKISAKHTTGTEYVVIFDKNEVGTVSIDPTTVKLPSTPVTVYYRKDTSGTTNNFANYLNKTSPAVWTKATNDAFTSAFPTTVPTDGSFVAAQGNDGVANGVMGKDGGIGYNELSFINERQAAGKNIFAAKIKNAAGEWITPSSSGASTFVAAGTIDAAAGTVTFNYDTTTAGAYPIAAISYGLANTAAATASQASTSEIAASKSFVDFFLNSCAPAVAEIKGYAALTGAVLNVAKAQAAKIGS